MAGRPTPPPACTHSEDVDVDAQIVALPNEGAFGIRVRILCRDCGMPFKFEDRGWRYDENRMLQWIVKPQGQ